jgi:glycosyltransferase involved in cell wall biosynthesis
MVTVRGKQRAGGQENLTMADRSLVSVVIPTYNRAPLLRCALESVAAQDYRPIEVLVIDDCSEDDTDRVVNELRPLLEDADIALRYTVLEVNSGPAAARNEGLRQAAGSFVAFLDSDDLWRPNFVSGVVGLMDDYPECGIALAGNDGVDGEGNVIPNLPYDFGDDADRGILRTPFERFIHSFPFITSATLVRRPVFDAVEWFDETLPIWQDADLWLRIAKRFDFAYTRRPLAYYRMHHDNISWAHLKWRGDQLRVMLRHLEDIEDPSALEAAMGHIRRAQTLVQEELLRERRRSRDYNALLYNECTPTSTRFRVGRMAMHGPKSVGAAYAAVIRGTGTLRRSLRAATTPARGVWALGPLSQARYFVPRHSHNLVTAMPGHSHLLLSGAPLHVGLSTVAIGSVASLVLPAGVLGKRRCIAMSF